MWAIVRPCFQNFTELASRFFQISLFKQPQSLFVTLIQFPTAGIIQFEQLDRFLHIHDSHTAQSAAYEFRSEAGFGGT